VQREGGARIAGDGVVNPGSKIAIAWQDVFKPDCGTLLNIRVYGTTEADYSAILKMVTTRYVARYVRDNVEQHEVPDYAAILEDCSRASVLVRFTAGVRVHLWFWSVEEIDLDFLPEDVDSAEKAQDIFNLMGQISPLLNNRVLLTRENGSATWEWSEKYAICSINPSDTGVTYHNI